MVIERIRAYAAVGVTTLRVSTTGTNWKERTESLAEATDLVHSFLYSALYRFLRSLGTASQIAFCVALYVAFYVKGLTERQSSNTHIVGLAARTETYHAEQMHV